MKIALYRLSRCLMMLISAKTSVLFFAQGRQAGVSYENVRLTGRRGSGNESFVAARHDPSRITEQISRNRAATRTTTASQP